MEKANEQLMTSDKPLWLKRIQTLTKYLPKNGR